jgi:hypothetical protein
MQPYHRFRATNTRNSLHSRSWLQQNEPAIHIQVKIHGETLVAPGVEPDVVSGGFINPLVPQSPELGLEQT